MNRGYLVRLTTVLAAFTYVKETHLSLESLTTELNQSFVVLTARVCYERLIISSLNPRNTSTDTGNMATEKSTSQPHTHCIHYLLIFFVDFVTV